jgi:cyclopropane fatty-acyl-phospholipid synthase-like methyltransferase
MKPYSEACEKNQSAILEVLQDVLSRQHHVLEIASGTGQHAVHFGRALPHLTWQTSELPHNHAGIRAWLDEAALPNVLPPVALDVTDTHWPAGVVDAVFNANTVHIVSEPEVERMFAGIARTLSAGGILCLYGPFNYHNKFTSESNARFDVWLKSRNPESGIRDFEAIDQLAKTHGLRLLQDVAMPSNNRTLVWQRDL